MSIQERNVSFVKMCELCKQNVFNWPDLSSEHLEENAEIFSSC